MIYPLSGKDVIRRLQVTVMRIWGQDKGGRASPPPSQRVRSTMVGLHLYQSSAGCLAFEKPESLTRCLPTVLAHPAVVTRLDARPWSPGIEFFCTGERRRKHVAHAFARSHCDWILRGFVRRNDTVHQEVQLAAHLRNQYPARSVIYGHRWGASEGVTLARKLGQDGIPVLLTIQVDNVSKLGEDDIWIPANVGQAVNFYQLNGLLHGRREILAADGSQTQILGNFQVDDKTKLVNCEGFPWYA